MSSPSKTLDNAVSTSSSGAKRGSAPNTTQTDLLLDIDFGSGGSSSTADTHNQAQVISNQQVTTSGVGSMFDSLDMRTQPVATMATTTVATAAANTSSASGGGGVFGDLVDLFGSNNNTAGSLASHTPQTIPQQVRQSKYHICTMKGLRQENICGFYTNFHATTQIILIMNYSISNIRVCKFFYKGLCTLLTMTFLP